MLIALARPFMAQPRAGRLAIAHACRVSSVYVFRWLALVSGSGGGIGSGPRDRDSPNYGV
jgi:hypothetical protein